MKIKYLLVILSLFWFYSCNTPTYPVTCNVDRECDLGQICNTQTHRCIADTKKCQKNDDCPVGTYCKIETGKCEVPKSCTDDESCYTLFPDEWDRETKPAKCNSAKKCVLDACLNNQDCIAGKVCQGGACVKPVSCDLIGNIKIISPSVVLKQGKHATLKAQVFNKNGLAVVVEDGKIKWSSSDSEIVSVNSEGIVTGGIKSGVAYITASDNECQKNSQPLEIENFANLENGKIRIVLRNLYTGKPVSNAKITLNGNQNFTTDSKGWIETENLNEKNDITVEHENFQYISIKSITSKDNILYLTPFVPQDKAGGYKGKFNFDKVKNQGDLKVGIAGASLPSTLLDISFDFLLSESYMKEIDTAGMSGTYAVPSNIVLVLGQDIIQEKYKVTTPGGNIAFWGIGSKMSMSEFLRIIQQVMGEDGLDMGALIRELAPYLGSFYHALKTNNETSLCNKIVDANDSNGNGETTDLIPDYNNNSCFPEINLNLTKELSLHSTVRNPKLVKLGNEYTDTAIAILGYTIEGNGFVPVGLTIGSDKKNKDDIPDQEVDNTILNYTPRYNGMEGGKASLVLLAMKLGKDEEKKAKEEKKIRLSGLIRHYDENVPMIMDFGNTELLKTTDDASLNGNIISFSNIQQANIYRIKIKSQTGKIMIIYSKENNIKIPDIENFGEIKFILIQAVTSSLDLNDIIKFNDANLNKFTDYVTAFSVFEL